jgi:RNA polymerase sigma factor (sigma-70 family)
MDLEALIRAQHHELTSRVSYALSGDRHAAEDLVQEAFARAWRSLPDGLSAERQQAWLRRTARNLTIDELRRRGRRPTVALDEAESAHRMATEAAAPDAAREALERLPAHQRFVLLLHFDAGFTYGEMARLLDTSEEAMRKRVARARAAFVQVYRRARSGDATPLMLVVVRDDEVAPYIRWLQDAGARVRAMTTTPSERELSLADGLVLTGAVTDVHAGLYGQTPRLAQGRPDLERDRLELATVHAALALDIPIVGVCRGHQLLNVASGGDLYQDVVADGATRTGHDDADHLVSHHAEGSMRSLVGRTLEVCSEHHQAVRRLGRGLRATGSAPDGLIESIERTDRRFAVGLQWHPESESTGAGDRIAEAMVAASMGLAA